MVVPYVAGGATDIVARILSARLSEVLRQQVIVENVGGAGGMAGTSRVAKAAPDGYQFVLGNVGTHAHRSTRIQATTPPPILPQSRCSSSSR
jgi:tripartite-type tricarboxylate transporter receptor subunit TctC